VISSATYFGGAVEISSAVNLALKIGDGRRVQRITMTAASKVCTLPDINGKEVPLGIHPIVIINDGANTWTLVDSNGQGFSVTMEQNKVVFLGSLLVGAVRSWIGSKRGWMATGSSTE
jgi:hypothetical protein